MDNTKYVINYCSGGLGNRLLPLSSCMELSNNLKRKIGITWPSTIRCQGEFKNLYPDSIPEFNLDELPIDDISLYGNTNDIINDSVINNLSSLFSIHKKIGNKQTQQLNSVYNDDKKYIIIYSNNLFLNLNNPKFIKNLTPATQIQNKVTEFIKTNKITDKTPSIHARSTDFINEPFDRYTAMVNQLMGENINIKIVFFSDSYEWEIKMKELYPNNIIIRKKTSYVKKQDESKSWINNVLTTENSVIEGLIDVYILSKTNLVMYNQHSSFAKLSIHLK